MLFLVVIVCSVLVLGDAGLVVFKSRSGNIDHKLSLAMTKKDGLTNEQKQFLLDYHNELRARLANGQVRGYQGSEFPTASNMLAIEWDEKLAEYAKYQSSACVRNHEKRGHVQYPYSKNSITENLQGRIERLEIDMFGEVAFKEFQPPQCHGRCGHFTAAFQWSVARVGCSYKYCPSSHEDYELIACEYSGRQALYGQGHWRYQDYKAGKQCSNCLKGYDYCLDGALCATKEMCASSERSRCTCNVEEHKCSENGFFDAAECRCTCNPGYTGMNCDKKCEDEDDDMCFSIVKANGCSLFSRKAWLCPETCNKCSKPFATSSIYDTYHSRVPKDNQFTVNAKTKPVTYSAADVPAGNCQNSESDEMCEYASRAGYCKDVVMGELFRCTYCKRSCQSCDSCDAGGAGGAATGGGSTSVDVTNGVDFSFGEEEEVTGDELDELWKRRRRRRSNRTRR